MICQLCGGNLYVDLFLVTGNNHLDPMKEINETMESGYLLVSLTFGGTSERAYPVAIFGRRHACLGS